MKYIPGYEGRYSATEDGRIYSHLRKGRWLKASPNNDGHLTVDLSISKGSRRTRLVHQLILETFTGPRPPGLIGLHKDDDKLNNHIDNLEWGTHQLNALQSSWNKTYSALQEYSNRKAKK